MEFFRGCENQDGKRADGRPARNALHDHFMVWSPTLMTEVELRRFAIAAGFGHEVKLVPVAPGSKREAYYVSKYIVKSTTDRANVPWRQDIVDTQTGELHESVLIKARYRTWSCSRSWGKTMAQVRREKQRFVLDRIAEREHTELGIAALVVAAAFAGTESVETDLSIPP